MSIKSPALGDDDGASSISEPLVSSASDYDLANDETVAAESSSDNYESDAVASSSMETVESSNDIIINGKPTDRLGAKRQLSSKSFIPKIDFYTKMTNPLSGVGFGNATIHQQPIQSSLKQYVKLCRRRADWTPEEWYSVTLKDIKSVYDKKLHPFAVLPRTSSNEFRFRHNAMFPLTLVWQPVALSATSDLPFPPVSPTFSLNGSKTFKRLKRFEFDPDSSILYIGGQVRCIAWAPLDPYRTNATSYVALTSLSCPSDQINHSDPLTRSRQVIQIWKVGDLSLTSRTSKLDPSLHFLIAHDWGPITDLCWIAKFPSSVTNHIGDHRIELEGIQRKLSTVAHNLIGHLLVACCDGYVRLFAVPSEGGVDPFASVRAGLTGYSLNPEFILKLGPNSKDIPSWLGWPTCMHTRFEFSERLFVGYSKGHVALYDLSALSPLLLNVSQHRLAPTRLFRLLPGPVSSLAVNPLNGFQLMVSGHNAPVSVWNLGDQVSLVQPDVPEYSIPMQHGLHSLPVNWPSANAQLVIFGRESCLSSRAVHEKGKGKDVPIIEMSRLLTRSDAGLMHTTLDQISSARRFLTPLGPDQLTSLDHSYLHDAIACSTCFGRAELVHCLIDPRRKFLPARPPYLSNLRIPMVCWSVNGVEEAVDASNGQTVARRMETDLDANLVAELKQRCADECSASDDNSCCWHKLWIRHRLTIYTKTNVPRHPKIDFVKSPLLNITQIQFSPNPISSTWLAIASANGFLHFLCADHELYKPSFDKELGRSPTNPPPSPPHPTNYDSDESCESYGLFRAQRAPLKVPKVQKKPTGRPRTRPRDASGNLIKATSRKKGQPIAHIFSSLRPVASPTSSTDTQPMYDRTPPPTIIKLSDSPVHAVIKEEMPVVKQPTAARDLTRSTIETSENPPNREEMMEVNDVQIPDHPSVESTAVVASDLTRPPSIIDTSVSSAVTANEEAMMVVDQNDPHKENTMEDLGQN